MEIKSINTDWTNQLSGMQVGDVIKSVPAHYHSTLCTTRTRLKLKPEHKGWHWSLKVANNEVTIKREK